jgi:hypothetical protein
MKATEQVNFKEKEKQSASAPRNNKQETQTIKSLVAWNSQLQQSAFRQ